MPYGCSIDSLLAALETKCLPKVDALRARIWDCEFGLLSVGLKIHLTELSAGFGELVKLLGGAKRVLEVNLYRHIDAQYCFVVPPVGNAEAAILLVECLEDFTKTNIFGNPLAQLQICSPGRLDKTHAALLAIAFYLGSDTLRRYRLQDLHTTVSGHDLYGRGKRIVLYDAQGEFTSRMPWWEKKTFARISIPFVRTNMPNPLGLSVLHRLPLRRQRTDILAGAASRKDIRIVNLAATLLVHAAYPHRKGYWQELGEGFVKEMREILEEHQLLQLLNAEWVLPNQGHSRESQEYFVEMLDELVDYAFDEAKRIHEERERGGTVRQGILNEVQNCLARYESAMINRVKGAEGRQR